MAKLTEKERELIEITEPLRAFLEKHYDPHCYIVVSTDEVRVVRDELLSPGLYTGVCQ